MLVTITSFHAGNLQRIRQTLEAQDLQWGVFTSPHSIRYLCGFYASAYSRLIALAVGQEGEAFLVVPEYERPLAERYSIVDEIWTYQDRLPAQVPQRSQDGRGPIAQLIAGLGPRLESGAIVGFEFQNLSLSDFQALQHSLPTIQIRDISSAVLGLRSVKTPYEIGLIERAARVASSSREAAVAASGKDVTETEVVGIGLRQGWAEAALDPDHTYGFFANVVSGARSDAGGGHDLARARAMDEDDLVFYAWGATCNGYWAMVGRTIYVGQKPPANLQDAFAVTRAAMDAAVLKLRPGNTAGEAGQAADDVIAASDFDTMCPVTVGGGMGLAMGELPSLHPSDSTTLQPGMVFRVGTEMYLRGRGTITCKCLVAVEAAGPRYLIHPPDGIICV